MQRCHVDDEEGGIGMWARAREPGGAKEGGEQEKVDRVRSFISKRPTDAGAVKKVGSIRNVSSGDPFPARRR